MAGPAQQVDLRVITTTRLTGERLGRQHRDLLVGLWSDPRVAAWLGGEQPEEAHQQRFERNLARWAEQGMGLWVLRERGTASFVGYAGLLRTDVPGYDTVEVAYGLVPSFWRQGLAAEITEHLIQVAFEQLDLPEVVAFTLTNNEPSQGVMRRSGMTYVRHLDHADLPHVLYVIKRPPS